MLGLYTSPPAPRIQPHSSRSATNAVEFRSLYLVTYDRYHFTHLRRLVSDMARQATTSKGTAVTTKARRRSPTPAVDSASENEDSPAESQASDDQDTIKLAKAMIESVSRKGNPFPNASSVSIVHSAYDKGVEEQEAQRSKAQGNRTRSWEAC